jgi:proteasome beta subunit
MNEQAAPQFSGRTEGSDGRIGELSPGDIPDSFGAAAGGDEDVEELKTGTTTVGIQATDGVVLAADRRASVQNMVASKTSVKIHEIHPTAAMTISGSVSAAQALVKQIRAEGRLYETRRGKQMSMTALSTMLANLLRSGQFLITAPVLGGVDEEGPHVYSFDPIGGGGEEEYTVSGSGSMYALGVLEDKFHSDVTMEEAETIAIQCIRSATSRDTASGNGMMLSRITEEGVETETFETMDDVPVVSE